MKPINLLISAFGPYAEEVEVPFHQFGEQGVFLITGDTGAGKTTIFDALTFALFGSVSGSTRTVDTVRSHFAQPHVETFVLLEFSHKGQIYKIWRSPQYDRPKKKGEGVTSKAAEACFTLPSGKVITKNQEVKEEMEALLGVDYHQWCQIAMIAQGEFLKLLLADSGQRGNIFRKLFDTKIYQEIQEALKGKMVEAKKQVEEHKRSIQQYVDELVDCTVETLDEKIEEDETACQMLKEESKKVEETIAMVKNFEKEQKVYGELLLAIESLTSQSQLLEIACLEAENLLNAAKKEGEKATEISEKIGKLQGKLPDFQQAKTLKTELKKETVEKDKLLASFVDDQENLARYQQELKDINACLKNKNVPMGLLAQGQTAYDKALEKKEQVEALGMDLKAYDSYEKAYTKQVDLFQEAEVALSKAKVYFDEKEQLYFREQAGLLARDLEDGQACPVCGSLEHPKRANVSDSMLDKGQLENLKAEITLLSSRREKESQKVASLGARNKEKKERILKDGEGILPASKPASIAKLAQSIKEVETCINEELEQLANTMKKLEFEVKALEQKEERQIFLEKFILKNEGQLEKIKEALQKYEEEILIKRGQLELLLGQLEGVTLEDVLLQLEKLAKEKKELEQAVLLADKQQRIRKEAFTENTIRIKEKKALLLSVEKRMEVQKAQVQSLVDFTQLDGEANRLEDARRELLQKEKRYSIRLSNNCNMKEKVKGTKGKLVTAEKEYGMFMELSNTANGNLSGKEKIALEQYVQAAYFKRIIAQANQRFSTMTEGRYLLVKKENATDLKSQSGLELDVYDGYTGKLRPVKSLSGGESFKASLSLALGLSDVIQNSAGGMEINTLFIDEGFGTLDSDSIAQVISVLNQLTVGNRMIGIISHGAELKESIDQKIEVESSNPENNFKGSRLRIVV